MFTTSFGFDEFVEAWRDHRSFDNKHADLARFHENRYRAYRSAFRVDLYRPPRPAPHMPDWMKELRLGKVDGKELESSWAEQIHNFVLQVEDQANRLKSPWSGYLESTPPLAIAKHRFGPTTTSAIENARSEFRSMSFALLKDLFPEAAKTTLTLDVLRERGYDPQAPVPDPIDYW
jgi:hypothetical protein